MIMNQKIWLMVVMFFSIITACLTILSFFYDVNIDLILILLGLTTLLSGLSQMNMAKQPDSNGRYKGNKRVGIFSSIAGIVIISLSLIKIIVM